MARTYATAAVARARTGRARARLPSPRRGGEHPARPAGVRLRRQAPVRAALPRHDGERIGARTTVYASALVHYSSEPRDGVTQEVAAGGMSVAQLRAEAVYQSIPVPDDASRDNPAQDRP